MSTQATQLDKTSLVDKYEKLTGKKNGKFLSPEKLEKEISKFDKKPITIKKLEKLVPVFKNGEPYGIVDNKYVPWKEAKIIHQENKVAIEILKLEKLKNDNR